MLRPAKFTDIPRMAEIIGDSHGKTYYAKNTEFDIVMAKQFLTQCVQRHGHNNYGGCLVLVSEIGGKVEGFIIGILDQIYPVAKELRATDIFFLMTEKAPQRDAFAMIKHLIKWGRDNPKVVEVFVGVNDVMGDWSTTARLYQKLGLSQCGGLFRLELKP